jgi:pimeloyl-ACP methyl ester carboxylesterase
MPTTSASGWTIHFETQGARANRPIVLTLGLSHRIPHWGKLPALLSERLFVVTWDCRGMGESERRDEPFTILDETRDLAAVMDAAGVETAALYGRSRGGMLVQAFALEQPQRASAIVLSGTHHGGRDRVGSNERVTRAMNFTPDMTREEIFAGQDEAMAAPGWRERDPDAFAYCLAVDLEAPPRRFAVQRQQGALEGWTSEDRLGEIRCPALVICGEDDGMVPPENSRVLAAGIPGARLELIPQCGHLPMLEQPAAVRDLVFDFLGV